MNPTDSPKRIITRIASVVALSIVSVALLHWYSIRNRGYVGGGFKRNFLPAPFISSRSVDLNFNSFYIAGLTKEKIYLGNYTAPLTVKSYNWDLSRDELKTIKLNPSESLQPGSVRLRIDSTTCYILNGVAPNIYTGSTYDSTATMLPADSLYFKDAVPIGAGSFVLKSESAVTHRDIIIRKSKSAYTTDTTFLERQIDGVFCTDGMLHYSKSLASLVYIYFYRNQYILADTTLHRIQRFNTIDTTTRARLKIASIESNGTKTLAAPPVVVNRRSCVWDQWLFVQSGLLADDEDPNDLTYYGVMDVYNLATHTYRFSFYLPFDRGNQLTSFSVFGNKIAAVFGTYLFTYEIRPDAFYSE